MPAVNSITLSHLLLHAPELLKHYSMNWLCTASCALKYIVTDLQCAHADQQHKYNMQYLPPINDKATGTSLPKPHW
jgi:hypothetical protein